MPSAVASPLVNPDAIARATTVNTPGPGIKARMIMATKSEKI